MHHVCSHYLVPLLLQKIDQLTGPRPRHSSFLQRVEKLYVLAFFLNTQHAAKSKTVS